MSCGPTHVVLWEPVLTAFHQAIAPEEWDELFGASGTRHYENLDLTMVDIQDIESATPFAWSTSGFHPVPEPRAPAFQIMDGSVDIDMLDGAGHALAAGASSYLAAYVHAERLIDAVKDLFQSIELLLKVRLEASNPLGLRDQPNNPTVLARWGYHRGGGLATTWAELQAKLH
jgi:hypothetical protein